MDVWAVLFTAAPFLILAAVTAVMIVRDPRRFRCAVMLLLTLSSVGLNWLGSLFSWIDTSFPDDAPYVLLGAVALAMVTIVGIAVFMIATGVVLISREGFGLAHSLSLIVGILMVAYFAAVVASLALEQLLFFVYLFALGAPVFLFSFALVAYLLYSALYGFVVRRFVRPGQSVVVLGSGLIGEKVPPLLGRRIELGLNMYERSVRVWDRTALVFSGGKGSDEQVAEGVAMVRYARQYATKTNMGVFALESPKSTVVVEDRSVSTRENLLFSAKKLETAGVVGPWTVVTSDFHAFRAANLLSRLGIRGNAVGAKSSPYFWMSAKLREFIAILADSKKTTIFLFGVSLLPLVFVLLVSVQSWL